MFQKCFNKQYSKSEARQMNPLSLAFIGDAIFEVMAREYVINSNTTLSAHKLHIKTIEYVKAQGQSNIIKRIESHLTEEELGIYKRGRNTKSATVPKNANVQEYRAATGFESLIGYLYLTCQEERLKEISNLVFGE